jgi:proline iminopeptidase
LPLRSLVLTVRLRDAMKNLLFCLLLPLCVLTAEADSRRRMKTSDGVELFVEVKGEGPFCLYIHGGPGVGSYWLQKFSGQMLERRFRMIYVDQRGSCRSSSPADGNYSIDRILTDFEEVRAVLGIEQWLTLGHSLGGILQVVYAERHPEVIKGMVMLNCSLSLEGSAEEALPKACSFLANDEAPSECRDLSIPLLQRVSKIYGELRKRDLWWKMGYRSRENFEIMNASFEDIPGFNHDFENAPIPEEYLVDVREMTAHVKVPVLFFYGRSDWMVGPNHYKSVKFPELLAWGSDVGHVPSLEAPDDLAKAIDAYLERYQKVLRVEKRRSR